MVLRINVRMFCIISNVGLQRNASGSICSLSVLVRSSCVVMELHDTGMPDLATRRSIWSGTEYQTQIRLWRRRQWDRGCISCIPTTMRGNRTIDCDGNGRPITEQREQHTTWPIDGRKSVCGISIGSVQHQRQRKRPIAMRPIQHRSQPAKTQRREPAIYEFHWWRAGRHIACADGRLESRGDQRWSHSVNIQRHGRSIVLRVTPWHKSGISFTHSFKQLGDQIEPRGTISVCQMSPSTAASHMDDQSWRRCRLPILISTIRSHEIDRLETHKRHSHDRTQIESHILAIRIACKRMSTQALAATTAKQVAQLMEALSHHLPWTHFVTASDMHKPVEQQRPHIPYSIWDNSDKLVQLHAKSRDIVRGVARITTGTRDAVNACGGAKSRCSTRKPRRLTGWA